jgi:uncharacterized protein (TIGR03437 family)
MSKLLSRNALAALALILPATAMADPVINAVANNFSGIAPGLPNYGIAPASLFVIYGNGLCDNVPLVEQTSAPPAGLPQKLNGMTISVTVKGVTTTPAIYYAIPTQAAGVLPSTTPVGTGTITVNYNGKSGSAPLEVTKSAFGILTANLSGAGTIKASNLQYQDITPTASAAPGQTIILWGSGLGADTANNDRTYPMKQDNLKNATVYIGGVKADVLYAGRSLFPGEDQIDVTLPALGAAPALEAASLQGRDVAQASSLDLRQSLNWGEGESSGFQGGCGISVAVVAEGVVSNFGTLPVNPGGGVCSDPELGITGTSSSGSTGTVKSGVVSLSKTTVPSSDFDSLKPDALAFTTKYSAFAFFNSATGTSFTSYLSLENCIVNFGAPTGNETVTGLDAGKSIGLTGGGLSAQLAEAVAGQYIDNLTSSLTSGTTYTFTGPGGKDVGSFNVNITFPAALDWTNQNSVSTINESQGQPITWTGGATGTYVVIGGQSSTSPPLGDEPQTVIFDCFVPVGNQQFTIPSYVLLALPQGKGTLGITNSATPVAFAATGISHGVAMATDTIDENVTYK